MDQDRFARLVKAMATEAAMGQTSIAKDDEIAEGILYQAEMLHISRVMEGTPDPRIQAVVEAIDTMLSVWGSGYDLAGLDDFVTDDETVADIVCTYVDEVLSPDTAPAP